MSNPFAANKTRKIDKKRRLSDLIKENKSKKVVLRKKKRWAYFFSQRIAKPIHARILINTPIP